MYTCIYDIHLHLYIHMYTCIYDINLHICTYMYVQEDDHTERLWKKSTTGLSAYTHVHMYIWYYRSLLQKSPIKEMIFRKNVYHVFMCTCAYIRLPYMHMYTWIHDIHLHMYTWKHDIHLHMHVHMKTWYTLCMYTWKHDICMYTWKHDIHDIHLHMHVHMKTWYTFTWKHDIHLHENMIYIYKHDIHLQIYIDIYACTGARPYRARMEKIHY